MGIARFQMTPELLREALHLPREASIVRVLMVEASDYVEVTVSHPDLKGALAPMMRPVFEKTEPAIVLKTWGVEP